MRHPCLLEEKKKKKRNMKRLKQRQQKRVVCSGCAVWSDQKLLPQSLALAGHPAHVWHGRQQCEIIPGQSCNCWPTVYRKLKLWKVKVIFHTSGQNASLVRAREELPGPKATDKEKLTLCFPLLPSFVIFCPFSPPHYKCNTYLMEKYRMAKRHCSYLTRVWKSLFCNFVPFLPPY